MTIALITPAYTARREEVEDAARRTRAYLQSPNPRFAQAARLSIERSVPPGERQQLLWQPWTSFVFVPLFALANAGVHLTSETLRAAATSSITLGVVVGLVLGKLVGILLGTGLAVKPHLGVLAPGLTGLQLAGGAALSGIGFTISLFIIDLAFDNGPLADQARVGVLAASVAAAMLGSALLRLAARRRPPGGDRPELLDPPVDVDRDHIRGPVDAPLTLVGYGDFGCPFCGRATGAVDELRERFGARLRYVFRHAPLVDLHPYAQLAAEAAEVAATEGRFWEMYDRLFDDQDRLATTGHKQARTRERTKMYAAERQQWLLNRARDAGRVDVAETAELLDVTPVTIRRDLTVLERQGLIRRVHGGAIPADRLGFEPGISQRDAVATQEKDRIAKAALDELDGVSTVLLDAGTTTARLAALLPGDRDLTVVTNAPHVAIQLASRPNVTLLLLGGRVRGTTMASVDEWAIQALATLTVDVAFIGTNGFSVERGLTTPDPAEAAVKRAMLGAARRAVVLADAGKHGVDQFVRFGRLDQVEALITDTGLDAGDAARIEAAGPRVVRA